MRVPRLSVLLSLVFAAVFVGKTVSQQVQISNEGPDGARVTAQSSAPRRIELEASTNFLSWSVVASTNGSFLEFFDPNLPVIPKRFFRASFTAETNAETLQIISPLDDAVVTTNRPNVEVAYSGFVANSTNLVLRSNGTNLPTRVTFANNRAAFELLAPLAEGFVTIYAARLSTNDFGETLARVDLNVRTTANNLPPAAEQDFRTTPMDQSVVVPVLANDRDPNGDALAISSFTQGTNGAVNLQDGALRYTPNAGFLGVDRFNYTVADGRGGEALTEVRINVLPLAGLIAYVVDEPMFVDEFREIPEAVAYVCNVSAQLGKVVIRTERPLTIGELRINCPVEISREDDRLSSLSGDVVRIISEANLTLIGMRVSGSDILFDAGANLNLFRMTFGGPTRVHVRDNPIAAAKKGAVATLGAERSVQFVGIDAPSFKANLDSAGAVNGQIENVTAGEFAVTGTANASAKVDVAHVQSQNADLKLTMNAGAAATVKNVTAASMRRDGIVALGDNTFEVEGGVSVMAMVDLKGAGKLKATYRNMHSQKATKKLNGADTTYSGESNSAFEATYEVGDENASAKVRATENGVTVEGQLRARLLNRAELELKFNGGRVGGETFLELNGKATVEVLDLTVSAETLARIVGGQADVRWRGGSIRGFSGDVSAGVTVPSMFFENLDVGANMNLNFREGAFLQLGGALNADFSPGSKLRLTLGPPPAWAQSVPDKKGGMLARAAGASEFVVTNCTFNVTGNEPPVSVYGVEFPVRIERNEFRAPTWGIVAGEVYAPMTIRSNIFIGCGMGIDGDIEGEGRTGFAPGPYLISENTMTEGYASQAISIQDAKMAIVERNQITARSGLILSAGYAQVSSNIFNGATNGSVSIRAISGPNGPAAMVATANTIIGGTPLVLLPDSYTRFESNRFVSVIPQGSEDPEATCVINVGNFTGTVSAAFRNNEFNDVTIAGLGPTYLEVSGNRGTFKEIGAYTLPPNPRTFGMVIENNTLSGDFPTIGGDGVSLLMRGNQIDDLDLGISGNFAATYAVVENNQFGGFSNVSIGDDGYTRLSGNAFGADGFINDGGFLVNDPGNNGINPENIGSPLNFNRDADNCADYPRPEYSGDPDDPCNNGTGDPAPSAPNVPAPVEPPWPVF